MDAAKYTALFLTESRDNLTAINHALLELERAPDAREPIDALFRAVHTVKGMSGMMGYAVVGELSHELETVLSHVRDGSRALTRDVLDIMFEAADALEQAIERSAAGSGEGLDVSPLVRRLRAATLPEGAAVDVEAPRWTDTVSQLPSGPGVAVRVKLAADTPLRGARALLVAQRAAAIGVVHATAPDEIALREERFGYDFALRLETLVADSVIEETLRAAGYVEEVTITHGRTGAATGEFRHITPAAGESAWTTEMRAAPAAQRYVRIDLQRLDALMNLVGELVISRGRLTQVATTIAQPELEEIVMQMSRQLSELQDGITSIRMVPVWQIFDRFPRVVRDSARDSGKEVEFALDGREIEVDRSLLDQIGDPLIHLLRNAIDHGIESPDAREAEGKPRAGRLVLSASRERAAVVIRVTDDGRGIDRSKVLKRAREHGLLETDTEELTDDEVLRLISRPGFSTAERVTSLSGRGVGIDAVATRVKALGGSVELRSVAGEGTSVSVRLPVTLAILPALLARVDRETYALPLTHVSETLQVRRDAVRSVRGKEVLILRGDVLPLVHLRDVMHLPSRNAEGSQVVVVEVADRRAGLVVDQLIGQQEIVVKPFDAARGGVSCFSGATILGDGAPALILEVGSLL